MSEHIKIRDKHLRVLFNDVTSTVSIPYFYRAYFYRAMLCIRGTSHRPVSVCLSVSYKSVFYRNGWTNRASFWHVSFLPPVLHCVKRKFGYLQNKGTSLSNFDLNSGLRKFRHGISIVETCYQLSSRKVDAQSDKLGRRRSTKSIISASSDARPL